MIPKLCEMKEGTIAGMVVRAEYKTYRRSKVCIPQKWLHKLKQINQQALDMGPTLVTISR